MGETAEDLVATMFALAEKLQPVKSVPPAWKAITGVPEEFRSRVQATQTVTPTATSLNDLTDVDTVGAVEGSILIAGGDGIWRPSGPEFVDAINQLLLDRRAWGAEWGYIWEIP